MGGMRRPVCVVIPGGPGLRADYLLSWARRSARGCRVAALGYDSFAGRGLESALRRAARGLRRIAPDGAEVLVGHSFGARLALELLRREPGLARRALLVSCPASFESSGKFQRLKRGLRLPAAIESEADFRAYWRGVLPLYFHRPPSPREIGALCRGTSWMKSAGLGSMITGAPRKLPRRTAVRLTFVNGRRDARFPASNAARLRRLFPDARHADIPACGHFPMLEKPARMGSFISGPNRPKLG